MLRLRFVVGVAFAALALGAGSPILAQPTGTTEKIDAAEKKLDEDIKACRPINIADYQALIDETNRNYTAAKAAAKAGAPIDTAKLNSDIIRSSALFKKAQVAAAQPCPPPQKAPPPKQAPPQPSLTPGTSGPMTGGGGGGPTDWDEFQDDAWGLLDDLDDDIWYCDWDDIQKLIPELVDAAKKAREIAKAAKAAGKYSKVKPEDAEKLASQLERAAKWAKWVKACPKVKPVTPEFKETPPPKTEQPGQPGQPKKPEGKGKGGKPSTLNDLFKPPETPTPPKHSIVEDLVEPPSPGELKILDDALREMGELGKNMKGMPGCDPKAWDAYIKRLELIAKRTRQMADWAKTPGQTTGVDPKEAQRVADEAQKQLDEAKKAPPPNCPKTTPQPKEEPKPQTGQPPARPTSGINELVAIDNGLTGAGCDIPKLEELLRRARALQKDAKAAGPFSEVSPQQAQQMVERAERALKEAKEKCPKETPKTTPQPKTQGMSVPSQPSPYQNVGTTETGPYGLSPRMPAPEAKHAKQEFDAITYGLGGLAFAFAASGGCDYQQLQNYIAALEDFARRARALAAIAREGGEFSTVNATQVQQLTEHIQRHIDEAKQVGAVDCPAGVRFKMNPWDGKIIAIHNAERAAVGALPLHWDPVLAAHADSYAQQLARTGQLTHAPREGRGIERENLGQGRPGWSPEQIVRNEWTSEKRLFRAGFFPNVCEGDWSQCAHYSQMIWPQTTDIGCGYAIGSGFSWLVCRYSPGGNKDGKPVGYRDPSTYLGGPLTFNPTYSPVLKAMRPVNPDKLEFGDEAVAEWKYFEDARGRCSVAGMTMAIDKLKYYAQAAHEHSAEERMKGNQQASGSYDAMARQLDERVQDASLYRDACARDPYRYPERG